MWVKALLLDTRSIQRYIFSGNRLRTNIGASYIVDRIFDDCLARILERHFPGCDASQWDKAEPEFDSLESECRLAFVGGGNALVLFAQSVEEDCIRDIVTEFTSALLTEAPGLHTGAAIGELDLGKDYRLSNQLLYSKLKENQNTVFPVVNVPYTGITLACKINGESANHYGRLPHDESGDLFFSQETFCKEEAANKANARLHESFCDELSGYIFPMALEDLGQIAAENYIAIVHIDGNNMGQRFSHCSTLSEKVRLSMAVHEKTVSSFSELLKSITHECEKYAPDKYGLSLSIGGEHGEVCLPIRPLILGGDDVTFICAGRMALTYAKRFMEYMIKPNGTGPFNETGIDCCAGIAISPTSYPFFRGYTLAEQLCGAAKLRSRDKAGTSWLDFAILHSEQAPTLEQIRLQEYSGAWLKNLHFGPYEVANKESQFSLEKLFACVADLSPGKHRRSDAPARNTLKDLRDVLQRGRHDLDLYIERLRHTEKRFPHIDGWENYMENIVDMDRTPLIDAIELIDFMPKEV